MTQNKTLIELENEWKERYEEIMSNINNYSLTEAKEAFATHKFYEHQVAKYYYNREINDDFLYACKIYGINESLE